MCQADTLLLLLLFCGGNCLSAEVVEVCVFWQNSGFSLCNAYKNYFFIIISISRRKRILGVFCVALSLHPNGCLRDVPSIADSASCGPLVLSLALSMESCSHTTRWVGIHRVLWSKPKLMPELPLAGETCKGTHLCAERGGGTSGVVLGSQGVSWCALQ